MILAEIKRICIAIAICGLGLSTVSNGQDRSLIKQGETLTLVSEGFSFTEGPSADRNGNVYFTDQPNDAIHKWTWKDGEVALFMTNSGRSNGLYIDDSNFIYACADEQNELWQIDSNKNINILIKTVLGKTLNGPNDLWMDKQGGIYFTDPLYNRPYWNTKRPDEQNQYVYYLTPDRSRVHIVCHDLVKPNGIIGSKENKTVYVADIGADKTYRYNQASDGALINKTLFADLGSDGLTIDNRGNVYLTGNGVHIFNPEGQLIEHIPVNKEWTSNVTFGGPNKRTLFITAMDAIYTIEMNVHGVN